MPARLTRALGLVLALGAAGCATQSNLVDLQDEVLALKARLARLDGGAGGAGGLGGVGGAAPPSAPAPGMGAALSGAAQDEGTITQALDLTVAVDQLHADLADLRGQVEEQGYTLSNLVQQSDSRLAALEAKAGIAPMPGPGAGPGAPPEGAPPGGEAAVPPAAPGAGVVLPGVLVAPRERDVKPGVSAQTAYQLASGDFKRGHYNLAAAGFANFLEQYPESSLVPDATYWLGESYRAQGLNARAVQVWDTLAKGFPKHATAPKALLALGETYRAMDNIPAAEQALKRLIASFPVSDEAQKAKLILSELR